MSAPANHYPDTLETQAFNAESFESVFIPRQLIADESETVGTNVSVYDPKDVEAVLGFRASVPVIVEADEKRLMVVDLRTYPRSDDGYRTVPRKNGRTINFGADFLLVSADEWYESDGRRGYKAIRADEPVVFGRGDEVIAQRFDNTLEVSRKHFGIEYVSGIGIKVTDLGSSNGTKLTAAPYDVQADRSSLIKIRMEGDSRCGEPDAAGPYGYLDGAPIIGRNSPRIAGGVYLGGSSREAIGVKPEEDPRIEAAYQQFTRKKTLKQFFKRVVLSESPDLIQQLEDVNDAVRRIMRYDGDAVKQLSARYSGDRLVSLGEYIENGIGVCRHQGLLAGYFLERMLADGKIVGRRAKVERNTIPEYGGSHGWGVLEAQDGTEYVVDPAQGFVGTKEEARKRQGAWDYYLPLQ